LKVASQAQEIAQLKQVAMEVHEKLISEPNSAEREVAAKTRGVNYLIAMKDKKLADHEATIAALKEQLASVLNELTQHKKAAEQSVIATE
jgi:hypothetical protein